MLKELCDIIAISGYEDSIAEYIQNVLSLNNNLEYYKDSIGNLIYHKKKKSSNIKVLVMAHMDEVGCQITKKRDENCYEFKPLGSVKTWNLNNQRVEFENGNQGVIFATQEKVTEAKQFEKLYVYSFNDNINIGDVFTFQNSFIETKKNFIAKSLDNRISVCGILETLSRIDISAIECDLYIVFTVQEEIGMRGAKVTISRIRPDVIINIDTSPVGEKNNLIMGHGVGIKISDSVGISDRKLVKNLIEIAKENSITVQYEVSDCGTCDMIMVNETENGSRTVGISIPCQFIHSANTIVNKFDYSEYKRLLESVLINRNIFRI